MKTYTPEMLAALRHEIHEYLPPKFDATQLAKFNGEIAENLRAAGLLKHTLGVGRWDVLYTLTDEPK